MGRHSSVLVSPLIAYDDESAEAYAIASGSVPALAYSILAKAHV